MPPKSAATSRARKPKLDTFEPREKLLLAAVELFARYGYDPVSTGQIAKAAGLTQSMVHYHFGSKSEIWKAAIERLMHQRGIVFPIGHLELQDLDPLTKLKVMVRKFLLANAADPNLNRILVHEGMVRSPRLKWLAQRYMTSGYRIFDQAIKEAIDAGLIRPIPLPIVTNIVVSACTMTFSHNVLIDEVYSVDINQSDFLTAFSNAVIDILFKGLEIPSTLVGEPGRKPRLVDADPKGR